MSEVNVPLPPAATAGAVGVGGDSASPPRRINRVLVLGGGSAGFLAAVTLKTRLPGLDVRVIRSREIGIIGVGEGTLAKVPDYLHGYLNIDPADFFRAARPVWKLGIRFLWGRRPFFDYTFEPQLFSRWSPLPKFNGFYCDDDFGYVSINSGLMSHDRAFPRRPDGLPDVRPNVAYHLENRHLVEFLERHAQRVGVRVEDDTVRDVATDDRGVAALHLASGRSATADLYVDCSGFASALLGKALEEPFLSFKSSLFCDRAVVGGWDRDGAVQGAAAGEVVQPYTVCETMDAGWCWRIDHEQRINRGYVFCSAFLGDEAAEREFRAKNPKVGPVRFVPYVSGRYRDAWVKNVVAVGNASGFVEPLESTSLAAICNEAHTLAEVLADGDRLPPGPAGRRLFNRRNAFNWDSIRRFLAVHYCFNDRLDTPFWRECREKVDLSGAEEVVESYREMGPTPLFTTTLLDQRDQFGIDGYMVMLLGQRVPHARPHAPTPRERELWGQVRAAVWRQAVGGLSVPEALRVVSSPQWTWPKGLYRY